MYYWFQITNRYVYSETSKLLSSSPDETTDFETMNPFFYKLSDQVDHIIQVLIVCFLLLKTLNFLSSLMKKKKIFGSTLKYPTLTWWFFLEFYNQELK